MREVGPPQISCWTYRINGGAIHRKASRFTGEHKVILGFIECEVTE